MKKAILILLTITLCGCTTKKQVSHIEANKERNRILNACLLEKVDCHLVKSAQRRY